MSLRSDLIRLAYTTPQYRSAVLEILGMEHPSEEARKQYLKDHPGADPKNHTVKDKGESSSGGDSGGSTPKPSKADRLAASKANSILKRVKRGVQKTAYRALAKVAIAQAVPMIKAVEGLGELAYSPMGRGSKTAQGLQAMIGACGLIGAGVGAALAAGPLAATAAGLATSVGVVGGGAKVVGALGAYKGIAMGAGIGAKVLGFGLPMLGGGHAYAAASVAEWAEKRAKKVDDEEWSEAGEARLLKGIGAMERSNWDDDDVDMLYTYVSDLERMGDKAGSYGEYLAQSIKDGETYDYDPDEMKRLRAAKAKWDKVSDDDKKLIQDAAQATVEGHSVSEEDQKKLKKQGKADLKSKFKTTVTMPAKVQKAIAEMFTTVTPEEVAILKQCIRKDGSLDEKKAKQLVQDALTEAAAEHDKKKKAAELRSRVVRLAYAKPDLQPSLLPLLNREAELTG